MDQTPKIKPMQFTPPPVAKAKKATNATTAYFRAHWVDYLLLVFICFALGAFDIFILKKSDKFMQPSYWYHAACRIGAYILAAVLGVRIGLPKAKSASAELRIALQKNRKLILLKEIDGSRFNDFICRTNIIVKINAWKALINGRLEKLNKKVPDFFLLYYNDKKEDYFKRFKPKKRDKVKAKADLYCKKRADLEALISDDYIEKNKNSLNVNYYIIKDTDFNLIVENGLGYKFYKTRSNVKRNAARAIGSSIIFTIVLTLVAGSFALSIDEALLEARIVTVFTVILNGILDIGLTLWRFLNGYFDCERIVREEDLRSCLDRNELLVLYKRELPQNLIDDYNREITEQQKEEDLLKKELEET